MQMGELQVDMSVPEDLEERGWEFTGIGIKVETLQSEQSLFMSKTLQNSQKLVQECLYGLKGDKEDINAIFMPLLKIINREVERDDRVVTEAVRMISTLIVDSNLL